MIASADASAIVTATAVAFLLLFIVHLLYPQSDRAVPVPIGLAGQTGQQSPREQAVPVGLHVTRARQATLSASTLVYALTGGIVDFEPLGLFVTFGNASGAITNFDVGLLGTKGSLYVTRPTLATHVSTRALLEEGANRLFDVVGNGQVVVNVNQALPLADCAEAHRQLEARETTGSTILEHLESLPRSILLYR